MKEAEGVNERCGHIRKMSWAFLPPAFSSCRGAWWDGETSNPAVASCSADVVDRKQGNKYKNELRAEPSVSKLVVDQLKEMFAPYSMFRWPKLQFEVLLCERI